MADLNAHQKIVDAGKAVDALTEMGHHQLAEYVRALVRTYHASRETIVQQNVQLRDLRNRQVELEADLEAAARVQDALGEAYAAATEER